MNAEVENLVAKREAQLKVVSQPAAYDHLAQITQTNEKALLEIQDQEAFLTSLIDATHEVMQRVELLEQEEGISNDTSYFGKLNTSVLHQEKILFTLVSAQEEVEKGEQNVIQQESEIERLRNVLQKCGVDVPEAPSIHRTKRGSSQREKLLTAAERLQLLIGSGSPPSIKKSVEQGSLLKQLTPARYNKVVAQDSLVSSTALLMNSECRGPHNEVRSIILPAGVLRIVVQILGPLRVVAQNYGICDVSLSIMKDCSVVTCNGPPRGLSSFETLLKSTSQRIIAPRMDSYLTYTSSAHADNAKVAAQKLRDLMVDSSDSLPFPMKSNIVILDEDI